jgi:2-iminobutanoate/2-iminopropanoate deaminase
MKFISTDDAPQAIGPYSQAVLSNGLIFCSGQVALRSDGTLVEGGIVEQTEQVLENLNSILMAAASDLSRVVKVTVYLKNMNDFEAMNEIYADYFQHNPARATVEVSRLPKNVLVEIDCIAEV